MSVLKYFKNIPRSPHHRATGPKCIFFLQIRNEVPEKKGGLSPPPSGDHWAQPTGAAGGPVAPPPPWATGVTPLYKIQPPLPSSFEPENSTKNTEKKRGVRRRKAAKPCRIQHL